MPTDNRTDVLIVNDDQASLEAMVAALAAPDLHIVAVDSGEAALHQLLLHDFAVILLDVMMPVLDGFQTAELIRTRPRSAGTPIIFITANAQSLGAQFRGYELGAVDFLLVPVTPHVLCAKVAVFVELHRKSSLLAQQTEQLSQAHRQLQLDRVEELSRINAELAAEIAERREAESRANYLATRDALTGLLNRRALHDRLDTAIESARRHQQQLALLYLDLDDFKQVNDGLGHPVGDELLRQVAYRLRDGVRKTDAVARIGGDEFVALLVEQELPESAGEVAGKLLAALREPYEVGAHRFNASASIGISLFPQDATDASELLRKADLAMYHAKQEGRGNCQYFSAELNQRLQTRHQLGLDLQHALERGELELHYQPEVQISSGRVVGVEALLRWVHPTRGIVPNEVCIPIAEETGLIVPIGRWVIQEACAQMRRWLDAGVPPDSLTVAINVSVPQFRAGLADMVAAALQAHQLPADCLQIEITESILATNLPQLGRELTQFGSMGIQIAIDDFGTGYSSLSMLRNLPIDLLKIDQSFVRELVSNRADATIVQTIIGMAHTMGLHVIAEGVETTEQLSALTQFGCDRHQGFLTSRPMSGPALMPWLKEQQN